MTFYPYILMLCMPNVLIMPRLYETKNQHHKWTSRLRNNRSRRFEERRRLFELGGSELGCWSSHSVSSKLTNRFVCRSVSGFFRGILAIGIDSPSFSDRNEMRWTIHSHRSRSFGILFLIQRAFHFLHLIVSFSIFIEKKQCEMKWREWGTIQKQWNCSAKSLHSRSRRSLPASAVFTRIVQGIQSK